MCDAGRLNYKWIGREDRLKDVLVRGQKTTWTAALNEIADKLKNAPHGSVAIIASARQTNEELWLLTKLAAKFGAMTDSVATFWRRRQAAGECRPQSEHERRAAHRHLPREHGHQPADKSPNGIRAGKIKT